MNFRTTHSAIAPHSRADGLARRKLRRFGPSLILALVTGGCGIEHAESVLSQAPPDAKAPAAQHTPPPPGQQGAKRLPPGSDKGAKPGEAAVSPKAPAVDADIVRWSLVPQLSFLGIEVLKRTGQHQAKFKNVTGHAHASDASWTGLTVYVETKSFEADVPAFAAHVRSKHFLDTQRHPKATFIATSMKPLPSTKGQRYQLQGELSLRGVEQILSLPVDVKVKGRKAELTGQTALDLNKLGMANAKIANELVDGVNLVLRLAFVRPDSAGTPKK